MMIMCILIFLPSLVPRPTPFFCSSVSVDNNTRMRKGGEKRFRVFRRPSASVYYCQRKPKRGRPGNEANFYLIGPFTEGNSGSMRM